LQLGNKLGWIGVDLGTHTVKLAQTVRTPDGVRLRHAAVIQRPCSWPAGDRLAVDEPDSSWPEIQAALECGGFRGRNAACVLPMNVCELRGLKVPQGDVSERRAMIASELADDAGESPTAVEFDYWELGGEKGIETADGFNVNVMTVTRPWIDQVASDCQEARLDCWAVDGAPLAMARAIALAAPARSNDRILVVDWGFSNTTLAIVAKGRPLYARRLHDCNFRSGLVSIQESLGVTLDHAQHLVDLHGVAATNADAPVMREINSAEQEVQRAVTDAVADTVQALADEITRTLRFLESQRRFQHPTALWLLGGGASVRNVGPYLAAAVRMPVSIWGLPVEATVDPIAQGRQAALFGTACALSALAWRAA
jgi:Tfp pilus assembly PilM family ATPase